MDNTAYLVIGKCFGNFPDKQTGREVTYANLFVSAPFVGNDNPDYHFEGQKAFTFKCVSQEALTNVVAGDTVNLYFDSKGKVALVVTV